MKQGWLAEAGPYKVEKIPCPDYAGDVDLGAPAKGVLHTTEGGWDSAMSVFRRHYAPHFLVGPGRVAQLLPLGRAGAALEHPSGSPATNGAVRAQVEIVGSSKATPWLPDAETLAALTALMGALEAAADIPLTRAEPRRDRAAFARATGWMGHADVPDNSHWDPGALRWDDVLAAAGRARPQARRSLPDRLRAAGYGRRTVPVILRRLKAGVTGRVPNRNDRRMLGNLRREGLGLDSARKVVKSLRRPK